MWLVHIKNPGYDFTDLFFDYSCRRMQAYCIIFFVHSGQ